MIYKEVVKQECERYALDDNVLFIGYNTRLGSRMYGTLSSIPPSKCIETPVAENLMAGLAAGLALDGYKPVLCFERHDFLLNALDCIVNHIDKLPVIGGYKLPVVIRAIVGSSSPLDVGEQHKQNYCNELKSMLKYTLVVTPKTLKEFREAYSLVGKTESGAIVIVEYKDLYPHEL